jgi:heptosyltransferase-1
MRLLIVRLSAMGDVIHALPLAANAHAAGATVGWLVERPFAPLLDGNPHCARVFVADTQRWRKNPLDPAVWREIAALSKALRTFAPDRSIDAQGLWKSAVLARRAKAPVVGFAAAERREPASAALCAIRVTPAPAARHVVARTLALLDAMGIPVRSHAPDARYLLARGSPAAETFLAAQRRPFVVLHPGAGRPEKAWGEERFANLARGLERARGLSAVVSWGPGDERRLERLRALLPGASAPRLLDFAGLARLFSASAMVVAGDTGPLHLADALGVSTLALFGPTDPERNGPFANRAGVVKAMESVSDEEVRRRAESILDVPPLTLAP